MRVIGTAGHVDHGKSTLVRRLTGIDPDRLKEEKQRQLTIDLGFAWLRLPDDEMVGIVDVPGHRDFIENMLAGVGSIDTAILVIAADEGIMPQTREHLAILDLLGISPGLVALTKTDMVDDNDWLELVTLDIEEALSSTTWDSVPVVSVSAKTGDGIDALVQQLQVTLQNTPQRDHHHHARLPIDRVFSVDGFGTVVTGTLTGGRLEVGDDIELQPSGIQGRIRGLQSYSETLAIAQPGSRVAVNIANIDRKQVERGQILSHPGSLQPTRLVDVLYDHLPQSSRSVKHNDEVKIFVGTTDVIAKIRLLDADTIPSGESGWMQLRLQQPVAISRNDRFILRYPSPPETIGGGVVVASHPRQRWKRFNANVIQQLETQLAGTPLQRLQQALENQPRTYSQLQQLTQLGSNELDLELGNAIDTGDIISINDQLFISHDYLTQLKESTRRIITNYHKENPLRLGVNKEAVRSKLGVPSPLFDFLLSETESATVDNDIIRATDHEIQFAPSQQERVNQLLDRMQTNPFTPPSVKQAEEVVGKPVLYALIERGDIVQVSADVIFIQGTYQKMVTTIVNELDNTTAIDVKRVRDLFQTSRKYAIALLEHLDTIGITKRVGDERVRGKTTWL